MNMFSDRGLKTHIGCRWYSYLNSRERNCDQQNGFLVHVPTEEKRGVGAEGRGRYEVGPCWAEEELDESGLERKRVSLRL